MRIIERIGNYRDYPLHLYRFILLPNNESLRMLIFQNILNYVVAVLLFPICPCNKTSVLYFGDAAVLELLQLFGVIKKGFPGLGRIKRRMKYLDHDIFFALLVFAQVRAAGRTFIEQADVRVRANLLQSYFNHGNALSPNEYERMFVAHAKYSTGSPGVQYDYCV